ncbi:MAG TPA: hypothetical protein VLD57_03975 [Blastocatellia bacterium]|nr:hypothetical protein [Blastocatellia bacterium]
MRTSAMLLGLSLTLVLFQPQAASERQGRPAGRQLFAVRGEVISLKRQSRATLLLTVRPEKGFAEAIILARENDLVGAAVKRPGKIDLLGLLGGDDAQEDTITAAELNEGDVVSVIYDPGAENRALEIYVH